MQVDPQLRELLFLPAQLNVGLVDGGAQAAVEQGNGEFDADVVVAAVDGAVGVVGVPPVLGENPSSLSAG